MAKKVLVVDDEKLIVKGIRFSLEQDGMEVDCAYDGEEALKMATENAYDMILLDIMLPKMDGFELCKEIRRLNEKVPILMLTALGSTDDKLDGFDAGADDYMTKPFDFRELTARVKVLLKRNKEVVADTPEQIEYADLTINRSLREVKRQGKAIKLSPKEYNLLLYMVENAEKVISRVEIAEKVWNTHFDTGTNFIDVYINYLRKKIDKEFDVKLIHTKPGIGFILTDKL